MKEMQSAVDNIFDDETRDAKKEFAEFVKAIVEWGGPEGNPGSRQEK